MCPVTRCRFTRPLAQALNILGIAFLVFFMVTEAHREAEILILLAVALVPLVSLMALKDMPDHEEKTLMREVRKARLRKELKDLESAGAKKA